MSDLSEAMDLKSDKLAQKINEISAKFDIAEELTGDDVIEYVEQKTELLEPELSATDAIVLEQLTEDFKFGRDTLKANIKNGRRVLDTITLELLDSDDDKKASLVMAFAELNKGMADNIKVFNASWKQLSEVLVNLDKLNKMGTPSTVNNTVNNINLETSKPISTVDLIASLKD